MKQKIKSVVSIVLGILYSPIYAMFIILHFVARFLLAVSYFGVFEKRMGMDILKSLFRYDYRRKY